MRLISRLLVVCAFVVAPGASAVAEENNFDPPALYLQWQRNPTTTMTIHWHTVGEARTELFFRPLGQTNWQSAAGMAKPFVGTERTVLIVELTGLHPATDYEFCFQPGARVFKFRTMPKDLSQARNEWTEFVRVVGGIVGATA